MKIKYFPETATLHIEFKTVAVAESRDLDENTILDYDHNCNVCGLTVEHAKERTDIPKFSYELAAA